MHAAISQQCHLDTHTFYGRKWLGYLVINLWFPCLIYIQIHENTVNGKDWVLHELEPLTNLMFTSMHNDKERWLERNFQENFGFDIFSLIYLLRPLLPIIFPCLHICLFFLVVRPPCGWIEQRYVLDVRGQITEWSKFVWRIGKFYRVGCSL